KILSGAILLFPTLPAAPEKACERVVFVVNPNLQSNLYFRNTVSLVRFNTNPEDIILATEEVGFYAQRKILFNLEIYETLKFEKALVEKYGLMGAYSLTRDPDWLT
ncbi:MAG: hypothetical protein QXL25_07615, partial [Candidatus Bathyarchaeia archaeon]